MSDAPQDKFEQQVAAAIDLLNATKRNLQLVDEHLKALDEDGRVPLVLASDVSSEHRTSWVSAVDDLDQLDGINMGEADLRTNYGFDNPKTGTIRNQEDAVFVCTDILVCAGFSNGANESAPIDQMFEGFGLAQPTAINFTRPEYFLRLTDQNTGRNIMNGMSTGPLDRDRAIVPLSYLTSIRPGAGANVKNRLFSEFNIPRGATLKAEVYNLGDVRFAGSEINRVFVSLLGYKVYGA